MCTRIGGHTRGLRSWMTLKVIHQFQSFWNASRLHLCSTLQDFNWHARVAQSLSDSWASCIFFNILWHWMSYSVLMLIYGEEIFSKMVLCAYFVVMTCSLFSVGTSESFSLQYEVWSYLLYVFLITEQYSGLNIRALTVFCCLLWKLKTSLVVIFKSGFALYDTSPDFRAAYWHLCLLVCPFHS